MPVMPGGATHLAYAGKNCPLCLEVHLNLHANRVRSLPGRGFLFPRTGSSGSIAVTSKCSPLAPWNLVNFPATHTCVGGCALGAERQSFGEVMSNCGEGLGPIGLAAWANC